MKKRSITIEGHRTSISLEDEFWKALNAISKQENSSLVDVVRQIDEKRSSGLSSAVRVHVLKYYQRQLGLI